MTYSEDLITRTFVLPISDQTLYKQGDEPVPTTESNIAIQPAANDIEELTVSDPSSESISCRESRSVNNSHASVKTGPLQWTAYSCSMPMQTNASAIYPHYDIDNPSSTVVLQAQPDLPIRLVNASDYTYTHASYRWTNDATEAWISPYSVAFNSSGTHFVAGGKERLALFDLNRDGQGPLTDIRTRIKQKTRRAYGEASVPLAGLISALAYSDDNLLAVGTTERQIGLYASTALTQSCAFELDAQVAGRGITQLEWSPCGRYLYVAERASDAIQIFDVRVAGKRLCWLQGRRAQTMQRMGFDLVQAKDRGTDLWAGGTDGVVRCWQGVTDSEGPISPAVEHALHKDAASSTLVCGDKLITTAGQRHPLDCDHVPSASESFLCLWQLNNSLEIMP